MRFTLGAKATLGITGHILSGELGTNVMVSGLALFKQGTNHFCTSREPERKLAIIIMIRIYTACSVGQNGTRVGFRASSGS